MSLKDKERLKELVFRGIKVSALISYDYFCGESEKDNPSNLESEVG